MRLYGILLFRYTNAVEQQDGATVTAIRDMSLYDTELAKLLALVDASYRHTGTLDEEKQFLQNFFSLAPVSSEKTVDCSEKHIERRF